VQHAVTLLLTATNVNVKTVITTKGVINLTVVTARRVLTVECVPIPLPLEISSVPVSQDLLDINVPSMTHAVKLVLEHNVSLMEVNVCLQILAMFVCVKLDSLVATVKTLILVHQYLVLMALLASIHPVSCIHAPVRRDTAVYTASNVHRA